MRVVISSDRAISEGHSPEVLLSIADWHTARADIIRKTITSKKKRAFGSLVSAADADRHEDMAAQLRGVASTVSRWKVAA